MQHLAVRRNWYISILSLFPFLGSRDPGCGAIPRAVPIFYSGSQKQNANPANRPQNDFPGRVGM
eukprot:scaffold8930_cov56-Skeletonema_dohrnii-CCMP3373.AAC.1